MAPATAAGAVPSTASRRALFYAVMMASGFAGLGYEMVWTRMLAVSLGHEIVAVLAVLAAFFVGLALGAIALSRRVAQSRTPHRWYAALELGIAVWAVALVWLLPAFNAAVPRLMGAEPGPVLHWGVAFGATLLLLLPATAAMGATLPAMERAFEGIAGKGKRVAGLYAANTFGAVAGIVATTFVLAPALGYGNTLLLCAAVNFACAVLMWRLGRPLPESQGLANQSTRADPRLLLTLFVTGLLGLAFEVLVVRLLSQVLENTVFTFAAVLSVYLTGTATGAALYHQWRRRQADDVDFSGGLRVLLLAAAIASLAGLATLWAVPSAYDGLMSALGPGTASALVTDLCLAALVFLLPTLVMGALFSHLAQRAVGRTGLGIAVGANTLGAALAPLLAGVVLLPAAGARSSLLLVSLGYLLLLPPPMTRSLRWASVPAALALGVMLLPSLRFSTPPEGGQLVAYRDGVMASVEVVADAYETRFLKVNNHYSMGSTSSGYADHRQTHLPLLLHPNPRSALFLGVGTGMSLNAAQYHPDLKSTAVELVPEVLPMLEYFETDPTQNDWFEEPRLVTSDARRFVVASEQQFDVIIADLFHPSRDGAGSLYTREHFGAVRERLAPGGLFCQWLPLFQMDLETLKVVTRTFADQFPHVQLHVPHFSLLQPIVGLVGSTEPLEYAPGFLEARVPEPRLQQQLVALNLNSDLALFGGFIADEEALASFAGSGPLNTDDRPLVTYRAPAFAYRLQGEHGERLVALVEALRSEPATLLSTAQAGSSFDERLNDYWRARDGYLRAGLQVQPGADLATMLAQTRDPLLAVVRTSQDFMPAYLPLLNMAQALASENPRAAAALLRDIDAAAPGRPEARRMLRALAAGR
ncbi:MAG: fused MFS/spermidine synthase [Pseudomonadota bacterium]